MLDSGFEAGPMETITFHGLSWLSEKCLILLRMSKWTEFFHLMVVKKTEGKSTEGKLSRIVGSYDGLTGQIAAPLRGGGKKILLLKEEFTITIT